MRRAGAVLSTVCVFTQSSVILGGRRVPFYKQGNRPGEVKELAPDMGSHPRLSIITGTWRFGPVSSIQVPGDQAETSLLLGPQFPHQ